MGKEKPQTWPLSDAMPAYVDQSPPFTRPQQNPNMIRLDNGAFTNAPPETRDMNEPPTWVLRNLSVANITVYVMFAMGPVLCAFGLLMRDDLRDE